MDFVFKLPNRNNIDFNPEEHWKVIQDYPDYEVSDLGNVRRRGCNRYLKGKISINGYKRVVLYNDNTRFRTFGRDVLVHRLVIETFNPIDDKNISVDHINNDKLDNRLVNLTYMSLKDNIRKANCKKVGLFDYRTKELIKVYDSSIDAARDINRSRNCVTNRIKNGTIINHRIYKYI